MTFKDLIGFILSAVVLLPLILIVVFRIYRLKSFLALGIYYLLALLNSMMMHEYIPAGEEIRKIAGVTYYLLEIPLILAFFIYFSPSLRVSRQMQILCLVFIVFEIIIAVIYGYNKKALAIILGPGLAILLFFCVWFFIRQVKIAATHKKAIGKVMIISALLFAFGCYAIIYLLFYIARNPQTTDAYLMYLISSAISVSVLSAGIIRENKRIQKLIELKVTRRELRMIYGNTKISSA